MTLMRTESERFDRVLEHPTYASAPSEPVGVPLLGIAEVSPSGVIATGLSLLFSVLMLLGSNLTSSITQAVLGLLLGIVGWVFYMSLKKANAVRDAPVERQVAVVVKERTDARSRFGDQRGSVRTYVTIQTRDGVRRELFAPKHMATALRFAVDDIGLAYVKADVLVDFIRIDV